MLTTAKQHDANTRSLLRTVPGIGASRRLVRLDDIHDMARFPRVQDFVSSCRLGKCAKASAGKRYGTSGTQIGHASLTWAFSDAAVLVLRTHPHGQQSLARLEKHHGTGKTLTGLAHTLARAVYSMGHRSTACDMQRLFQSARSGADAPDASLGDAGGACSACAVLSGALRRARLRAQRPLTLSPTL
jgi:transposase